MADSEEKNVAAITVIFVVNLVLEVLNSRHLIVVSRERKMLLFIEHCTIHVHRKIFVEKLYLCQPDWVQI